MRRMQKLTSIVLIAITMSTAITTFAGNEQRVGQAGATQLQINPFARSTGMASANSASVHGLEASFLNVAGLAFTESTELIFSRTNWLSMGGVNNGVANINAFGFTQKVGESGVLGVSVMSMGFGDIEITTVSLPEGGSGTFSPTLSNIGISYAQEFSNSIYGGFTLRGITESISNISAQGMCFDAGIQYVTGAKDNFQFGVSLNNIGPRLLFEGDGISFRGNAEEGDYNLTVEQRTDDFEMPSLLNIGMAYDLPFLSEIHRVSGSFNFTSNSFQKDQFRLGVEYAFNEMFMIRTGYIYEEGVNNPSTRTTALRGPCGGITLEVPIAGETTFGLDYSYQHTDPFYGNHRIGVRIDL
tara:strand:- start:844 stop:1911 length:1068 start_codon:yes stop_codon:yes gene_type:complete